MKRNIQLANRIREVLLNGKWIANTNYEEQLTQVSWKQAVQKVHGLNTIAELTFHVNYYLKGLLHFFDTGKLEIKDEFSFKISKITAQEDWDTLVTSFVNNSEQFAIKVSHMDNSLLDQIFVDRKYGTYERNIEGVIEHSYYHLGQIVLLKRMIGQKGTIAKLKNKN
ncbi:MAG: DUF1572 domain-containing protein [Bacteroidota bacterium]